MLFFLMVPNWMLGSIRVDIGVLNGFSFMSQRRGPNCDSVKSGGIDLDENVAVEDVDDADAIGCFFRNN